MPLAFRSIHTKSPMVPGTGVAVCVGVCVGVRVGVLVGVFVGVNVGVLVGVFVGIGVFVGVFVGVNVGVLVGVGVAGCRSPASRVRSVWPEVKVIEPVRPVTVLASLSSAGLPP